MCELVGQEKTSVQPTGGQPAPEAVEEALRETYPLPAWRVTDEPVKVTAPVRKATLKVAGGLDVSVADEPWGPFIVVTVPAHQLTTGRDFEGVLRFLPAWLADVLGRAVVDLQRIAARNAAAPPASIPAAAAVADDLVLIDAEVA